MSIPTKDALLVEWSTNAHTRLLASPTTYGTTSTVATEYGVHHDAYVGAYDDLIAARSSGTRSEALTSLKSSAKIALLDFARPLYKQIQANAAVADSAKIELGVVVPSFRPTPKPVPGFAPRLTVTRIDGRLVTIELSDPAHPTRKRMPDAVDGATVLSFVGPDAPTDTSVFKFEGNTSKVTVEVLFPESVAPGTQVWLSAFFFNNRKQSGPACMSVGAIINYGGTMPMAA